MFEIIRDDHGDCEDLSMSTAYENEEFWSLKSVLWREIPDRLGNHKIQTNNNLTNKGLKNNRV